MWFGNGDWDKLKTPPMGSKVLAESDEELRERLLYVAGESSAIIQQISRAVGKQLDELAAEFGLKRRALT